MTGIASPDITSADAPSSADTLTTLTRLIEPVVTDAGFDLYDVQQHGTTLQVLITATASTALDTTTLSQISRALSHTLDEHDPLPGKYTLEVSSPGLERKLIRPDHFIGAIGETVTVKLTQQRVMAANQAPTRRVDGVLLAADQSGIAISLPAAPADQPAAAKTADPQNATRADISYADITTARTIFCWGNSTRPNSKKGATK